MKKTLLQAISENTSPLVIGHRGYAVRAPENTLPSFSLCMENHIPAVEFDVHLCGSGELVVIHDDNLRRTTGFDGVVEKTPLGSIQELDAGSWFSREYAGARIPLLEEVFELLGKHTYYDIEIKWKLSTLSGLEGKLVDMIRRFDLEGQCLITSFNPVSLKEIKRLSPNLLIGLLYTDTSDELPRILRKGAGRFLCRPSTLNPEIHFISKGYMRLYHRLLKYPIIPWTVDKEEDVRRCKTLGVAGIISNNPGMVRDVLNEQPV